MEQQQQEILGMMMEDKEIWAPIDGQEGYEISTYGRVRSYWKSRSLGRGKGTTWFIHNEPVRFLSVRRNAVCFKNHQFLNITMLVAKAFIPNPKNYTKVLRYTANTNHISNLRWYDPCEDEDEELWKPYLDGYAVSSHGRVRSYWERISVPLGGNGFQNTMVKRDFPQLILPGSLSGVGYLTVRLEKKNVLIHRLVGKLFIPNPHGLPNIDHVDRNKLNNHISNLRWCNQDQNRLNTSIYSNNTSGVKGIRFLKDKNCWQVFWSVNNKCHFKCGFKTKEEAIEFRNKMVEKYYDQKFYSDS